MTKPVSISKKPRKQHTPEFRNEALKLAERIGVAAAARELNLYESQLYAWRSKQQQQMSSSERESELAAENVRLKRQLAEQAEELAILQKAATYFAKRLNFSIFKLSPRSSFRNPGEQIDGSFRLNDDFTCWKLSGIRTRTPAADLHVFGRKTQHQGKVGPGRVHQMDGVY
ncbi:transposase IS3 [Klebsiella pneumoniae]|uniref:Transposase IS3 n=1 Tax=Klebsiella pneumoniae TaxID=573 RepID=A0A2X3C1P0_KLEPN|nr:transposase IS3 [Klebsiella pneumoniae]